VSLLDLYTHGLDKKRREKREKRVLAKEKTLFGRGTFATSQQS